MIPTYNCAGYLRDTLQSVLAQDPGPSRMQIEVVDDHSTQDDPLGVVNEIGRGRVLFYQQPRNVGNVANFNTCIGRSAGRLLHILHGDDWVRPGFYSTMEQPFLDHPEIGAAFCRYVIADDAGTQQRFSALEQPHRGIIPDWLARIARGQRLQTPSMVVRRSVYEALGGFDARISYVEDWEMWVRIAANYPVWYETEPLAVYRVRASSLSGGLLRTGENIARLRMAIEINRQYLPPALADTISTEALESCALAALRRANRLHAAGDRRAARAQAMGAWRTSHSAQVIRRSLSFLVRSVARELRRAARVATRSGYTEGTTAHGPATRRSG
ncbi:hypothetical protein BH24GEM2_BH24GEM2_01730 [soil metagenome]